MGIWASRGQFVRELARELYELGDNNNNNSSDEDDVSVLLVDEQDGKQILQLDEKNYQIPLDRRREEKKLIQRKTKSKTHRRRSYRKRSASLQLLSILSTFLTIAGTALAIYSIIYPHWLETTADLALPKIKLPLSKRSIVIRLKLHAKMALYQACIKLNVTASTVELAHIIDTIRVMEVSKCYDKDSKMKRRKRRNLDNEISDDNDGVIEAVNDIRKHSRYRRGIFVKNPYGTDILFMMRHFVYVAIGLVAASFMAMISLFILLCVSPCVSTCMCRCCKRTPSLGVVVFTSMLSSAASLLAVYIASSELGRDGDFLLEGMNLMKSKLYPQRSNPIVQLLLKSPLEEFVKDGWTMGLSYYLAMGSSACFCFSWIVLLIYLIVVRMNQQIHLVEEGMRLDEGLDDDRKLEVAEEQGVTKVDTDDSKETII